MRNRLTALLRIEPHELAAVALSFAYYFCLLCAYYILRPIRDEMGIQGGVQNLQWVFTGTFVAMLLAVPLFGWAAARFERRRLVPIVYYFFIANLALFYLLFELDVARAWVARAFFVWISVFNLFVVSVFWSLMADVFSNAQARRLFGIIAAGGSAGAIVGPGLTAWLAGALGPAQLIPFSIGLLVLAVVCVHGVLRLRRHDAEAPLDAGAPVRGGLLAGAGHVLRSPYLLGIGLFILLYTTLSTFLYFEQAHIVKASFSDAGERTRLFAMIDLSVNVLTVFAQLFVMARLVERIGVALTLALIPLAVAAGFAVLGLYPTLAVLVVFQVLRRAGNYAITRPGREVLFTVIPREDKYKSKNFIDTVVYRGGDAVSGWAFALLSAAGLALSTIAWVAVPLALLWAANGFALGRRQEVLRTEQRERAWP
ncbi:MAG TPA: MFS transporter [Gammaproteobacteria bacterium]|nr:MFS transporter [Gammaproteobacteria bacterium]